MTARHVLCRTPFAVLALVLSHSIAGPKAPTLLDALLDLEANHQDLCKSALGADYTRAKVSELMAEARRHLNSVTASSDTGARGKFAIETLNGIVFGHAGIRPSQDLHDPCNLFVSSVLARKQGYCVGVAGVYLVLAEGLDLPVRAVATPTHLFLRYDDGETAINIDPLTGGENIPDERYVMKQYIPQESIRRGIFLSSLSQRQVLAQFANNLGVIYSERRDRAPAARAYEEALRLDDRLPAAWYNRGKLLFEQGAFEESLRAFSKAIRLNPNDTWALNNRGMSYRALGKQERALADFEAALRIDPTFEPARANRASSPRS